MRQVLWGEYKKAAEEAAYCGRVLERVWSTRDRTEWEARKEEADARAEAAWVMWMAV